MAHTGKEGNDAPTVDRPVNYQRLPANGRHLVQPLRWQYYPGAMCEQFSHVPDWPYLSSFFLPSPTTAVNTIPRSSSVEGSGTGPNASIRRMYQLL